MVVSRERVWLRRRRALANRIGGGVPHAARLRHSRSSRVGTGEPTSLGVDGAAIPVRKYVVDGKTRYTVWLNSHNLPVKFAVDDNAGQATFTSAKCVSCKPLISQMGMR
jgi:hypothetical protein